MINLLNLNPNKPSLDVRDYIVGIYGQSGAGKSTTAVNLFGREKSLVISTEVGVKSLHGVYTQPVFSWTDCMMILGQLRQPKVKEKFDAVIIDTIGNMTKYAIDHILKAHGATGLNDSTNLPYGAGHTLLEKMFFDFFQEIQKLGYGLIIVSHEKQVTDQETEEQWMDLAIENKRIKGYITNLLDYKIYVEKTRQPEEPNAAYFKATPFAEAKARGEGQFTPQILFNAENIRDNIIKANTLEGHDNLEGRFDRTQVEVTSEEAEQYKSQATELGKKILEADKMSQENLINKIKEMLGGTIAEASVNRQGAELKALVMQLQGILED